MDYDLFERARRVAGSECRMEKLEKLKAPGVLLENEKKLLRKRVDELGTSEAAAAALGVARRYAHAENSRREALDRLILGRFKDAVELAADFGIAKGSEIDIHGSDGFDTFLEESRKKFFSGLQNNNPRQILDGLNDILAAITTELNYCTLPPAPSTIFSN